MAKDPAKRAESHEQALREHLAAVGGYGGRAMRTLDVFFSHYHQLPTPENFSKVLGIITDLQIMQLPEHRFGVAGGIAAVVSLHPDLAATWKKDYPVLISSAERLTPPLVDNDITNTGHIEYLFLWWLVTRDAATLDRLVRIANSNLAVATMAKALMLDNVNLSEIKKVVDIHSAKWSPIIHQGMIDAKIQEIANLLIGKPNVMCVGKQANGVIVCVTTDGLRPPGGPEGVTYREPTREELQVYRTVLDQAEDP